MAGSVSSGAVVVVVVVVAVAERGDGAGCRSSVVLESSGSQCPAKAGDRVESERRRKGSWT